MKQHNEFSHTSYPEWKHGLFSYKQLALYGISPSEIDFFWILDGSAWPNLPQRLRELGAAANAWPLYLNTYLVGPEKYNNLLKYIDNYARIL